MPRWPPYSDEPSAGCQLFKQWVGNGFDRPLNKDAVIRAFLGKSVSQAPLDGYSIVNAGRNKRFLRFFNKLSAGFNSNDRPGDPRQNGRAVTCPTPDHEHIVIGLDSQRLNQPRQHHWFHHAPAAGYGQILVDIGDGTLMTANKIFTWDNAERINNAWVRNLCRPDLAIYHHLARLREFALVHFLNPAPENRT